MTGQHKFKHFLCPMGLRIFPLSSLVMTASLLKEPLLLFYTRKRQLREGKKPLKVRLSGLTLYSSLSGPKSSKLPGRVPWFFLSLSSQSTQ